MEELFSCDMIVFKPYANIYKFYLKLVKTNMIEKTVIKYKIFMLRKQFNYKIFIYGYEKR